MEDLGLGKRAGIDTPVTPRAKARMLSDSGKLPTIPEQSTKTAAIPSRFPSYTEANVMDSDRFDRLARGVAHSRLDRRAALRGGTAAVATIFTVAKATGAQGTPTSDQELASDKSTLFVQTAQAGTFVPFDPATPDATSHGTHVLTLSGHPGQTIGFSDRPQRNFGSLPTGQFLTELGFTPDNPPNAALVVSTPAGDDVLVVELLNPSYDPDGALLMYEANILAEYTGAELAPVADQQRDSQLAEEFDRVSLFIDDCPDANPLNCYNIDCTIVGDLGDQGMCWNWSTITCEPCNGGYEGTAEECNERFSLCNGHCLTATPTQCLMMNI